MVAIDDIFAFRLLNSNGKRSQYAENGRNRAFFSKINLDAIALMFGRETVQFSKKPDIIHLNTA